MRQVTPPPLEEKPSTGQTELQNKYYMMHGRIEVPVSIEVSIQMTPDKPITFNGKTYSCDEPTLVCLPAETFLYVVFVQSLKIIEWINYKQLDKRSDGKTSNANFAKGDPGVLKVVATVV